MSSINDSSDEPTGTKTSMEQVPNGKPGELRYTADHIRSMVQWDPGNGFSELQKYGDHFDSTYDNQVEWLKRDLGLS